jgi:hypothetical protein
MHIQAAEDIRAEAAEKAKQEGEKSDADTEAQLNLAKILADGGLPRVARLDVGHFQ